MAPPYAPQTVAAVEQPVAAYPNPVFIPAADPRCGWEQVVDTVDDYFRIEHEQPAQALGDVGNITAVAEVSPTIFEPWRQDTVDPQERWENTLQSMRRRAVVHVTPTQRGQWVEVQVFKELEDDKHPDRATAGAATFRYDNSLTRIENPIGGQPITKGWISRGRDTSLEQYMIGDLLSRFGPQTAVPAPLR